MSAACCAGVLPLRATAPPLRLMLAKTLTRFASMRPYGFESLLHDAVRSPKQK